MLAGNDLPGKTWPNGKHISYRLHHHFSLVNQVNQYPVFSFERFISGVEFPINQGFPERLVLTKKQHTPRLLISDTCKNKSYSGKFLQFTANRNVTYQISR
jgi:hypothetical protein